jgi:hypothetical protein
MISRTAYQISPIETAAQNISELHGTNIILHLLRYEENNPRVQFR